MAIYSSILARRIPWTEEPGRLHTAHVVTKSQTQLSNYHTHTQKELIVGTEPSSLYLLTIYINFVFFF